MFTLTGAQATIAATAGVHNVTISSNELTVAPSKSRSPGRATREGGADRYATAAQLFNTTFGSDVSANRDRSQSSASGTNFPDALSATLPCRDEQHWRAVD